MKEMRIAVLGTCLSVPVSVFAGSVLELETTEYYREPPAAGTIEISTEGGSLRTEVKTDGNDDSGDMIFRGATREMISIDHANREYYVLDEASMQQVATQLSSAMEQMQQALKDLPPEQREMAEQMMKQHMPAQEHAAVAPITLHKTGNDDSINGFDCEYYEMRRQEIKIRELCVTGWDEIAGGRDIADAMLNMADFFESMAKDMADGFGSNIMHEQQEIFAQMRELDGYPVLTREYNEDGKIESEIVLKSAATEDIDPELFNPPAGYSEKQLGL